MLTGRFLKQILIPYTLAAVTSSILLQRPAKQPPKTQHNNGEQVLALMRQGDALVKVTQWYHPCGVVKLDHHKILIENLADLNKRTPVRVPRSQKQTGDMYYKLNLMTQEIETHTNSTKVKKTFERTHTRKLSTTLIANLSTPLFDDLYNDTSWIPTPHKKIGLLFNLKKSIVCAMATGDFVSYQRNEISSSKEYLNSYQAYAKKHNMFYNDIDAFKKSIEDKNDESNEVLAKLNTDALAGILVEASSEEGVDPQFALHAMTLQAEIEKQLSKKVPIIFYDRQRRDAREYHLEEQKLDVLALQLITTLIYSCAQDKHFTPIAGKNISSCAQAKEVLKQIEKIDTHVLYKEYRQNYLEERYDPRITPTAQHPGFFFRYTDSNQVTKMNTNTDLKPPIKPKR